MKYLNKVRRKIADISFTLYKQIERNDKFVSFTFDDVPKSTFENAGNILHEYNVNGTFYVALSLMSTSDSGNLYSPQDIKDCYNSGNEIGCHSFSHFHFFRTFSGKNISNDFERSQTEFRKLSLDTALCSFSYPFGEQTWLAKKHASRLYSSCRGIDYGINIGKVDINNLKSIQLYEDKYSLHKIDEIISNFKNTGGWLIFYTHDVQNNFSKYGCSPEYFKNVVDKVYKSDFKIKSVKQVIELLSKRG